MGIAFQNLGIHNIVHRLILNLGITLFPLLFAVKKELKYENDFYPASSQPVLYVQGGVKKQLGDRQYANDFVNTKRHARQKPSALRVNDFWNGLKVSCEIKIVHFKLYKITRIPLTSVIFDHFLELIIVIF